MSNKGKNDESNRFGFGDNWASFLSLLNEDRVESSMASLQEYLQVERLDGCRFLDIGSGSGLSSLAARRLGADVTSFDFDPQSVACTRELKRRYFRDDEPMEGRRKGQHWTESILRVWGRLMSFIAGAYFTILAQCGWGSRTPSVGSNVKMENFLLLFITIRVGSHIFGGSSNSSTIEFRNF